VIETRKLKGKEDIFTTMENSSTEVSEEGDLVCTYIQSFKLIQLILCCVLVPTSVIGNCLIITSLCKYRKQFRGSLYMFTGNLAVSDILMALGMSLHVVDSFIHKGSEKNIYYCLIEKSVIAISIICSGMTFMAISLDRLLAVFFPFKHKVETLNTRKFVVIILLIWITAIGLGCVTLVQYVDFPNTEFECVYLNFVPKWLILFDLASTCWIIVFSNFVAGVILFKLHRRNRKLRSTRLAINVRTHLMVRIYLVFGICWVPYVVVMSLQLAHPGVDMYRCMLEYTFIGGILNAGFNWMIYGLANVKFRKCFKALLCNKRVLLNSDLYLPKNKSDNSSSDAGNSENIEH